MKTDYKIGDKIRVIKPNEWDIKAGVFAGQEFTVDAVYSHAVDVEERFFPNDKWNFWFQQIEPVEKPHDNKADRIENAITAIENSGIYQKLTDLYEDELQTTNEKTVYQVFQEVLEILKGGE